jgi:serine/threonine protein kinase
MDLLEQLTAALGERYRVERELGHGGMAVVFPAEDLKHHRRVAIKLLKPELSPALGSERFLREIEIAAALQHPHILSLYDSGLVLVEHPKPFDSAQGRLREGPYSVLY